jgi:hypothetical protein
MTTQQTVSATFPVYTAKTFLEAFEPSTLAGMMDPQTGLASDTVKASEIATAYGLTASRDGAYPAFVWALLWP